MALELWERFDQRGPADEPAPEDNPLSVWHLLAGFYAIKHNLKTVQQVGDHFHMTQRQIEKLTPLYTAWNAGTIADARLITAQVTLNEFHDLTPAQIWQTLGMSTD